LSLSDSEYGSNGEVNSPITTYGPVEHFIALQSSHLEKLELSFIVESGNLSVPFRFPVLPRLKFFHLDFLNESQSSANFMNGFLSLMKPNQFPILDEIYVKDYDNYENQIQFTAVFFPSNCRFDSVSKLTLDISHRLRDNLTKSFPNLTYLEVHIIDDDEGARRIFSYTKLKHLVLYIEPQTGTNINSLISGILHPERFHNMSEEDIAKKRRREGKPSILDLSSEYHK